MANTTPLNIPTSLSQEPKSSTPIALRTRRCQTQVSFVKAAHLKQCRICPASFPSLLKLKSHVLSHKPNTKRRKALEAIDSLLMAPGIHKTTPTSSQASNGKEPTKLFSKFQQVFPELFRENVSNRNTPCVTSSLKKRGSKIVNIVSTANNSQPDTIGTEIQECVQQLISTIVQSQDTQNTSSPVAASYRELQEDLFLSTSSSSETSSPPSNQEYTPTIDQEIIPPLSATTTPVQTNSQAKEENDTQLNPSPHNSSPKPRLYDSEVPVPSQSHLSDQIEILENSSTSYKPPPSPNNLSLECHTLEGEISILDLILSNTQESYQTSTPASTQEILTALTTTATPPQVTPIAQEENHEISTANNLTPHLPQSLSSNCPSFEGEESVLDLILTNTQEPLEFEDCRIAGTIPKISPLTSPKQPIQSQGNKYTIAASNGQCLLCLKFIDKGTLLQHLYHHKPSPTRAKCLEGFRTSFPPDKLPKRTIATSSPTTITTIEKTFREKFPDLPVFNENSSSSNSSDESILLAKLDSPPTGPPPVSPFKRALYSRVVKKGLFRCQYCEKSFISEAGANRHRQSIHGILPHITRPTLFPDCPPEMCRVCSKGPAPYETIAEHYQYVHNLSISSSIPEDSTTQINVPTIDFVSSAIKHNRNFIQQKPASHSSNLTSQQITKKAHPSNSNKTCHSAGKPPQNLKIISRPELRGTGTSKLVLLPATKKQNSSDMSTYNKKPPAPSTSKVQAQIVNSSNKPKIHSDRPHPTTKTPQITSNSNIITTIAEIHENVESSSDEEAQTRICNKCGFVAHKMGGLKLHYFRAHQIKKIPKQKPAILDSQSIRPIPNSPRTTNSISSEPQQSHLPGSSKPKTITKPATKEDKTQEKYILPEESRKQDGPNQKVHPSAPHDFHINTQEFTNSSRKAPSNTQFHSTGDHLSKITIPPPIDRNHHAQYPYVSFNNNILKYYFPVPLKINCPFNNCSASFGTKAWFLTNSSIKKHLNIFHKCPPSSVEFYCFFCKKKIKKSPALHPCLKNNLIIPKAPIVDDSEWTCEICNTFSTTSRLGKQNHLASHKRDQIRKNAPPLIIPESNAALKRKRRKKVTSLAEGPPGDTRLAPPLLSVNLDRQGKQPVPTIPAQDDEEDDPSTKIDLPIPTVLSSFLDPLDALIEVDDLENAMTAFEKLMDGITTAVQEHFHLPLQSTDPSQKRAGKSRKNFDPMNAQEVQKLYKWNRRRCVRNIACPTSNRCTIAKEALSAHFTSTWGAPNEDFVLHGSTTQDRPPILESLDPEFVFSCLQTSENSA
ncbi:uncharacterized protein NPIL_259341, partial [Nephila pilipes]